MGEYAIRKSDDAEIKIGTCESMYYIREIDRDKVIVPSHSCFGHYWRIPFIDEDHLQPGEYDKYNRAQDLYGGDASSLKPFAPEDAADDPGIIQLRHDCGLLVNADCFHGLRLPTEGGGFKSFWNGHHPINFELAFIKRIGDGPTRPVYRCKWCSHMWSTEWVELIKYIPDPELRERLIDLYCQELAETITV